MTGADDPHLGSALAIFRQHLQQLGLQRLRQIPDFVEEEGTAPGLGKQTGLAVLTEQLQVQRSPGQGGAVDGMERLVAAVAGS